LWSTDVDASSRWSRPGKSELKFWWNIFSKLTKSDCFTFDFSPAKSYSLQVFYYIANNNIFWSIISLNTIISFSVLQLYSVFLEIRTVIFDFSPSKRPWHF
jgi:hypothetical protein